MSGDGLADPQAAGLAASESALRAGPAGGVEPTPPVPLVVFRDLCLDALDPQRVAAFWGAALGRTVEHAGPADGVSPDALLRSASDGGPDLYVNGVAEPRASKNRMHLDVTLRDGRRVDELVALGATVVTEPGERPWWVLADPEGNEFCAFLPAGPQVQADPVAPGAATNDADAETLAT